MDVPSRSPGAVSRVPVAPPCPPTLTTSFPAGRRRDVSPPAASVIGRNLLAPSRADKEDERLSEGRGPFRHLAIVRPSLSWRFPGAPYVPWIPDRVDDIQDLSVPFDERSSALGPSVRRRTQVLATASRTPVSRRPVGRVRADAGSGSRSAAASVVQPQARPVPAARGANPLTAQRP